TEATVGGGVLVGDRASEEYTSEQVLHRNLVFSVTPADCPSTAGAITSSSPGLPIIQIAAPTTISPPPAANAMFALRANVLASALSRRPCGSSHAAIGQRASARFSRSCARSAKYAPAPPP